MFEDEITTVSGEEVSEVTEPTVETSENSIGEKETEIAEPSSLNTQTDEDNARYASIRRKAEEERDKAIAREREKFVGERADIERNAIASLGLINTYTGEKITTREEYEAFRAEESTRTLRDIALRTGMDENELQSAINSLPVVQRAKVAEEKAKEAETKIRMDGQIKELQKYDPKIKSVGDLLKMENYAEFEGYVKKGNSFVDAYRLANFDKLTKKNDAQTRQATLNAINSKSHLTPTSVHSGAGEQITVPDDIRAMYKALNPNATDAEISAHWAKEQKRK